MPLLIAVGENGEEFRLQGEIGHSVKDALLAGGVPGILGLCGGSAACGTCHVYVDPVMYAAVGAPGANEAAMLAASSHQWWNSRLACQIRITDALDGLRVVVAPLE